MLNVITIGSHSHLGSPALGEVCHHLADVFSWQLFPDGLQCRATSNLSVLEFILLFQHGAPDAVVQHYDNVNKSVSKQQSCY